MDSGQAADLADLKPLTALGHPVRRRLYSLVATAGRAIGRDEAAASVGVGRSLAAYHLDKLAEEGLLEVTFERRGGRTGPGAGRPAKIYRRARREFVLRTPPRDYRLLAELLVRAMEDDKTGVVHGTLERVAHEFGRDHGEREKQEPLADRERLTRALRRRGYEPFDDEDGTLRLRNCPFETVARQCPAAVCGLNLRIVQGLLAGLEIRNARAVLEPAENGCCVAITT